MSNLNDIIRNLSKSNQLEDVGCGHKDQVKEVAPMSDGCVDCLKMGDTWVHLRLCLTCGYVGCCNDSKNKHGSKHYAAVAHPLIKSFEPGEDWVWCYPDEALLFPD
jgi:uncharacterized UBP type Zn finger protein